MGLDSVIGAGKTGEIVEENDDVVSALDEAPSFLNGHFGNLNVSFRRFVESGSNNFPSDGSDHVGHLFRALVNEEDHEDHFGVIGLDCIGDLLHQDRFARLRRSDDQGALPFSNGRGKVEYAVDVYIVKPSDGAIRKGLPVFNSMPNTPRS